MKSLELRTEDIWSLNLLWKVAFYFKVFISTVRNSVIMCFTVRWTPLHERYIVGFFIHNIGTWVRDAEMGMADTPYVIRSVVITYHYFDIIIHTIKISRDIWNPLNRRNQKNVNSKIFTFYCSGSTIIIEICFFFPFRVGT